MSPEWSENFVTRIKFLVGPNGCGKTRQLVKLVKSHKANRRKSIAIANTTFVRFPRNSSAFETLRISPRGINRFVAKKLFKLFDPEETGSFEVTNLLNLIGFHSTVKLKLNLNDNYLRYMNVVDPEVLQIPAIKSMIEIIRENPSQEFELVTSPDSYKRSISERNQIFLMNVQKLEELGILWKYDLLFEHKKRGRQLFQDLSSGEQTLISTFLFIKSHLENLSVLFVDEPENSLHPEWQRRYVEMLNIAIGYNNVRIVVATHSPVVVSGAKLAVMFLL